MKKPLVVDDIYQMADELYEDDFMDEAIILYKKAMSLQAPSLKHLTLLSEAEHIAKTIFLSQLHDRYPNSWQIKFEWAIHNTIRTAIATYSELLENDVIDERTKTGIRRKRFEKNCKLRSTDYDLFKADFLYLWHLKDVPSQKDTQLVVLRIILNELRWADDVGLLKRLLQEIDIDEKAKAVLEAKIEELERLADFIVEDKD